MYIRQNVKYGENTVVQSGVGTFDYMNTLLLLATEYFEAYQKLTGASLDEYVYYAFWPLDGPTEVRTSWLFVTGRLVSLPLPSNNSKI